MLILSSITISLFIVVNSQHVGHVPIVINTWFVSNATKAGELTIPVLHTHVFPILIPVVSKSGNPGPGPVPKTRAQIRIFFITSLLRH